MVSSFSSAASQNMTCFVAGTLVMTASGLMAIEKIKAGDRVLSADPETMQTGYKSVLETYIREVDRLIHLTVNGEEIVTTYDHPFYVKDKGFINAEQLWIGAELVDNNGNTICIEQIYREELDNEIVTVYNFQVDEYHTYYVGNCCVLVHNAGDLYKRAAFRKSTHEKALREAPKNQNGEMICPTCGKKIQSKIIQQTKNGPRIRKGYDLDHYPTTWNERVQKMKTRAVQPSRSEVLDIFNEDVRVQCPKCNQGHQFEGIKGGFAK